MRLLLLILCLSAIARADGLGKELSGAALNVVGSGALTAAIAIAASSPDESHCVGSCRDIPPSLTALSLGIAGGLVLLIGIPLELWGASQRRASHGKKAWFSSR